MLWEYTKRILFNKGQSIRDSTGKFRENKGHLQLNLRKICESNFLCSNRNFPYVVWPLNLRDTSTENFQQNKDTSTKHFLVSLIKKMRV